MAGLNSLLSNVAEQKTSMPSWYDTAQQNIVSGATSAYGAAPAPGATVGQKAVNILGGPADPFGTAAKTLQGIASGAASPWMTDATGKVVPDTSTALGGLFGAQEQELKQLMPEITATPTAAGIGSGQFGSLRSQTATNKAIGDALAQMRTQQMQAALQNQQTGVQAGLGAGTLTNQQIQDLLTTGQYQQAAPFTNVSNLSKVVGAVQAPTTVSSQTQLSPLNQIGALTSLLGGSTTDNLLKSLGIPGGLGSLSSIFSSPTTSSNPFDTTATMSDTVTPISDLPTSTGDLTSAPAYDWSSISTAPSSLGSTASGVSDAVSSIFG